MKEKTENERTYVADRNLLNSDLSQKAEVRRRISLARKYRFPWLLIIMILIVFLLIFVWFTYFLG